MKIFPSIHPSLYEYLQEDLPPEERKRIEVHLARCPRCTEEARKLKSLLSLLPSAVQPSEALPPEYWQNFSAAVERRLEADEERDVVTSSIRPFVHRPAMRWSFAAGAFAFALGVTAVLLFHPRQTIAPVQVEPLPQKEAVTASYSGERMEQYFRKSKILLVGLSNMKVDDSQDIDLSAEQKISRELLYESRYIRQQPIDPRSARLVGDMEKILAELANTKEHDAAPNIRILRGGIHQQNLLFKVRMAEQLFDSASVTQYQQSY